MIISGATHSRRSGAIPNPAEYDGGSWSRVVTAGAGPVTATLVAAWAASGAWGVSGDTTPFGSWILPQSGGVGASYQIRISVTQILGNGVGLTITNPAATWVSLSTDRQLIITSFKPSGVGANLKQFTVTIEIRRLSDAVVVSTGTVFAEVNAEVIV